MVGKSRPVLRSAMGRAVLASVSPAERELMLRLIIKSKQPDASEARDASYVRALVLETRTRGYASAVGLIETHIGAIALPVRSPKGVMGALNLVFFRSAIGPAEAAERYLPHMRESVAAIEAALQDMDRKTRASG
jgi:IclR family mhp operon transcriptional activator